MSGQRLMMAVNAADGRTFSSLHNCRRSVPSSAGHAPASHCAYLLSATSCKSSGNMCGLWALESSPNVQKDSSVLMRSVKSFCRWWMLRI